jgi:hypothetical protein
LWQVLHTYGDLGDGPLLQTYGFIDEGGPPPAALGAAGGDASAQQQPAAAQAAGAEAADKSGKKRKGGAGKRKAGSDKGEGDDEKDTADGRGGADSQFVNPHNAALVPFEAILSCSAKIMSAAFGLKVGAMSISAMCIGSLYVNQLHGERHAQRLVLIPPHANHHRVAQGSEVAGGVQDVVSRGGRAAATSGSTRNAVCGHCWHAPAR